MSALAKLKESFSSPLIKIIGLAVVLAIGFLLTVLAGAIYGNWLPILVLCSFAVAHLPIVFCGSWTSEGDDFISETTTYIMDFGKFFSAFLVVSSLGLPAILCHTHVLTVPATVLSVLGGLLVYFTVVAFTSFFDDSAENYGF